MCPRSLLGAATLLLCGCGDSGDSPADAGSSAAADASPDALVPFEPAAPEPPALPAMAPCPEGWRAVAEDDTAPGLVVCDPWPETGYATCADDEAHFPGTPGCEVVGTPCGDGDWATDLPEGAEVVYVRAGAVGGNGLRLTPFGDLQHAIDVAAARGAIVALSKGTFDGQFFLEDEVSLWGACTAETIVTRSEPSILSDLGAALQVSLRGGVTIRNLTITGEQAGVFAFDPETLLVLDSVIVHARHWGIYADAGAVVDATNIVVRDTLPSEDGQSGYGLFVLAGAHVTVTRAVFSKNRTSAATALEEGTELVVRDAAMMETLPEELSGSGGSGLEALLGAHVVAERVVVLRGHSGGLVGLDEGSLLEATDVSIRDIVPTNGVGGHGVVAWFGARFTGRRIAVSGCGQAGVHFNDPGTTAEVEDLVVTDTQAVGLGPDLADGVGFGVGQGAMATAQRVLLARNIESALVVDGQGSTLVAGDVTALDTAAGDGARGSSLVVSSGGTAEVTRFHAARSTGAALLVLGFVRLVDALVEATGRGTLPFDGGGLAVGVGGEVEVERGTFRDLFGMGITAAGGRFTGRDVLVEHIAAASGFSSGVLALGDGTVELTSFLVSRSEVCGVQVALEGAIDLHDGEVRDNAIGANVQDPAFDLARIQDGVRYVDNGTPLDTSSLPLPDIDLGH